MSLCVITKVRNYDVITNFRNYVTTLPLTVWLANQSAIICYNFLSPLLVDLRLAELIIGPATKDI
jgi:hypothetical protein